MRHHPSPTAAFRYRVGLGRSSDGNDDATGDQDHNHAIPPAAAESVLEPITQRKRVDGGRFRLQVDRQTKASYATYEAAEQAGLGIKKEHPILQVAIYDGVESVNKIIELP